MKILMHDNALSERGTTNAMIGYARLLVANGCNVGISFCEKHRGNNLKQIEKISSEFNLFPYRNFSKFARANSGQWDSAYWIKSGENDGKLLEGAWNLVHAVFQVYEPHGDKYVYVSQWLAEEMKSQHDGSFLSKNGSLPETLNKNNFDFLPHIIELPESSKNARDLVRESLEIPKEALVGIRYGGFDTFDLSMAHKAVIETLELNPTLHYIFLNTKKFTSHKRVHFLPAVIDEVVKTDFLSASDFFLHGRVRGESFGMAIAEAKLIGLPTYVWSGGEDKNHLRLISQNHHYSSIEELIQLILTTETRMPRHSRESNEFSAENISTKLLRFMNIK